MCARLTVEFSNFEFWVGVLNVEFRVWVMNVDSKSESHIFARTPNAGSRQPTVSNLQTVNIEQAVFAPEPESQMRKSESESLHMYGNLSLSH